MSYLVMDHMMGLDIIGWLNVVGMSHMVNRDTMDGMMDRSMDCMDSMMNRSRDSMMNRGRDSMMYRGCMDSMMYRSRDSMDSMNRGGGDGLVVHRSSVQRRVN